MKPKTVKTTEFYEICKQLHISLYSIRKALGVSAMTIHNWAHGISKPTLQNFNALHDYMLDNYTAVLTLKSFDGFDKNIDK